MTNNTGENEEGFVQRLILPIIPVGKGRPRFSRFGHAFTPKKTRDFENELAYLLRLQWKREMLECPIKLDVTFFLPEIKKRDKDYPRHWKRPDVDNLIKGCVDAGNKIIWKDDAQIWLIQAKKLYDKNPRIIMNIYV